MAVAADELRRQLEDVKNVENSELAQELEVLKEIYITELSINCDASGHFVSIDVQLHPATGENVSQKWVCLTLQLLPPPDYPHSIPEIIIRGPRGLAEEHVASLKKSLYQIAEDRKGEPMMYQLIESAKESLTRLNIPYGQCMICLDDFSGSHKEFTKTDCYHYFHCDCLARYLDHCKTELEESDPSTAFTNKEVNKQIVCPVCREMLPCDLNLSAFLPASEAGVSEGRYTPSEEMQELQRKMAELYKKQMQKGGIIDLEAERNKYLLPKDFLYAGSVEESSQDAVLSESVQPLSVLEESDGTSNYNQYPQHQRQRDHGGRGGNKGIREHQQGGKGARKNREGYVKERSEYGREDYGSESRQYDRKRGEFARDRGKYYREGEGYRRTRQGEDHGTWQNKEGSKNRYDRSNRFYDERRPRSASSTTSEVQNKSAGNENASSEKIEQMVETKQKIETESSRHGINVTQENQVDGRSDGPQQLQDVEERQLQATTDNSRENDTTTFQRNPAPSEKAGNFQRRDRRRQYGHHDQRVEEEFSGKSLQKSHYRERKSQAVHSRRSDDGERSKKSPELLNCSEQTVKATEIPHRVAMADDEKQNDMNVEPPVMSRNHGERSHSNWKADETRSGHRRSQAVHSRRSDDGERSKKNPELQNYSEKTVKATEIPQRVAMADDEKQNDVNVEPPVMSRNHVERSHSNWKADETRSGHRRSHAVHSRRSDDGECSKKNPELQNCSEETVKAIDIPQKMPMADEASVMSRNHGERSHSNWKADETHSGHRRFESVKTGSLYGIKKPAESGNRHRWQRNHRQGQGPEQYKRDCSPSNSLRKDEILTDKIPDEARDISYNKASLEKASILPDQLKDLVDGRLCATKMQDPNKNSTDKPQGNRTSGRHDNHHYKSRFHARENTLNAGNMNDHHECCVSAEGTNRQHLQTEFHSKPNTATDGETMKHLGEKTMNQKNHKKPQRFQTECHQKEGRQSNHRQKFSKDANLETAKARNEISESQLAQNDSHISTEPHTLLGDTNLKSSQGDRSNDTHPGLLLRSISTVNTGLLKDT